MRDAACIVGMAAAAGEVNFSVHNLSESGTLSLYSFAHAGFEEQSLE